MRTAAAPPDSPLPERFPWPRVQELFFAAADRPPAERPGFLAAACPDEPGLAAEVAALLAAEGESAWLVAAVDAEAGRLAQAGLPPLVPGDKVGPYRIEREVGRGGMGSVYFAVRDDDEYRREVALKVLRAGLAGPELAAFFRRERQILAGLEHPAIARLYDGGTTPEGQSYFAMERVEGEPLTVYCDRRRLSIGARLRLFLQVCSAVSYAHQKLVVHRDLKPSNILVTAEGVPKLLDFGIAREAGGRQDEEEAEAAPPSAPATPRLLTPGYASPEQWRGEAASVAGDVYSLGVILFELLAGRRPEPGTPLRALDRRFGGDLDAITARALAPRAAERYGSVEQLAADLQRHLEARPVAARSATWPYRAGRWLTRHRLGLGIAAGIAALVLTFAASSWRQAARTAVERDKAEQVSAFLTDLFLAADPATARGREVTARELLDRGAARLGRDRGGSPEVRAALAQTLGRVYVRLGDYPRAEPLLVEALALRQRLRGPRHLEVAASLADLADLRQFQGRYRESEGLYRRALSLRRELLGEDHPEVAESLDSLADALQDAGDYARAEPLCRQALAVRRRLFPPPHADLASSLNSLALLLHYQGRLAEAEPIAREALAMRRQLFGEVHPEVAEALNNLGTLRDHQGDLAGAEAFLRQAVAIEKRLYGADGVKRSGTLENLGMLLYRRRRWAEAEKLLRESLALQDRALQGGEAGGDHPEYATSLHNLALVLVEAGRTAEAEELFRQAIAAYRQSLPADHPFSAYPVVALGTLLLRRGEPAAAEPWLREGLRIHRATLPAAHPSVGQAAGRLGLCEAALGRRGAAAPLLEESCAVAKAALGDGHWRTQEACGTVERFRRGERLDGRN